MVVGRRSRMTTLIILLLGAGAVFGVAAFASDSSGNPVNILGTISNIWNDNVSFSQSATTTPTTSATSNQGTTTALPNYTAPPSTTVTGMGPGVGSYIPVTQQVVVPPTPNQLALFQQRYYQNGVNARR